MTTRPVRGIEIAEVDEAAVASYLAATPEFFDRHAQLLAKIRLPDARGGASTVSLLERQVEVLRERNRQLERKVKDFLDVARENDTLGSRVLAMARRLISAKDQPAVVAAIESALAYPEETAGLLMSRDFVAFPENRTVGDLIDYLREHADLATEFW